ncbi:hypothetical protein AF78_05880 [Aliarcobacter butzleri L353]|nr:hypothetical protein AF78_05880 [Aliarcobacter butzleri L353]
MIYKIKISLFERILNIYISRYLDIINIFVVLS